MQYITFTETSLLQVKENNQFCIVKTLPFLKEVMILLEKDHFAFSKTHKPTSEKNPPTNKTSKRNPLSSASFCGSNDQEQQHHTSSGLYLPGCDN